MSVKELNKEQITQLKQNYYCNVLNINASYEELANINNLVDDIEIYEYYNDTYFVDDDFTC